MIIAATLFACITFIIAAVHAGMIKDGKRIKHGAWAALYLFVACLLSWLHGQREGVDFSWWMLFNALLIRAAIFNPVLNKHRGLGWWYITPELKNVVNLWDALRKGRTWDYIHSKIFGKKVWLYSLLYLAAAVVITIKK